MRYCDVERLSSVLTRPDVTHYGRVTVLPTCRTCRLPTLNRIFAPSPHTPTPCPLPSVSQDPQFSPGPRQAPHPPTAHHCLPHTQLCTLMPLYGFVLCSISSHCSSYRGRIPGPALFCRTLCRRCAVCCAGWLFTPHPTTTTAHTTVVCCT